MRKDFGFFMENILKPLLGEKISNLVLNEKTKSEIWFDMVYIEKGIFQMEGYEIFGNRPPRETIVEKSFLISETPITQELYQAVMNNNPSSIKDPNMPATSMTWFEAMLFCNRLSELQNLTPYYILEDMKWWENRYIYKANVDRNTNANGYRLPTEIEWEYCAKAGTDFTYSGSNCLSDVALVGSFEIYEVKSKKPNAWGLYDMSGNVCEWCDTIDTIKRNSKNEYWHHRLGWVGYGLIEWEDKLVIVRGGGSGSFESKFQCTSRDRVNPGGGFRNRGIRIVRNFDLFDSSHNIDISCNL